MAASILLSSPFIISTLPANGSTNISKQKPVQASTVLNASSTATKKRKRTEIAVAVQDQGVSIINLQGNKTVSTYSLPPSTWFSCPPVSTKATKDARRRTYASISHPRPRIVGWDEKSLRKDGAARSSVASPASSEYDAFERNTETYTRDITKKEKILRLDVFPRTKKANSVWVDGDVMAVWEDGALGCWSSDLKVERWMFNDNNVKNRDEIVFYATTISCALARKTIFASRSDILIYENGPAQVILLTLSSGGNTKLAHINCYAILPTVSISNVRPLVSVPIELPHGLPGIWHDVNLSYHAISGTLHIGLKHCLLAYNLNPTIPKLISQLNLNLLSSSTSSSESQAGSLLRISANNVLVSRNGTIYLCDTKYKSVHASRDLVGRDGTFEPIQFLTYLQDLGLVVVHHQNNVLGLQITKAGGLQRTTLMDSLCKGIESYNIGDETTPLRIHYSHISTPVREKQSNNKSTNSIQNTKVAEANSDEELLAMKTLQQLQSCARSNDISSFEATFSRYVGFTNDDSQTTTLTARSAIECIPDFIYPDNDDNLTLRPLSQAFVSTVLSYIFTTGGKDDSCLEMTFYPPRVVKFLLLDGYFSSANIPNQAIGLVDALIQRDAELNLLHMVLELAKNRDLPLNEVVRAVQVVLEKLVGKNPTEDSVSHEATQDASLDSPLNASNAEEMVHKAALEAEAALAEVERLLDVNDTKEQILRTALEKINRFPRSAVVQSFRETLGGSELAGLIRILRRELIRDGDERSVHPPGMNNPNHEMIMEEAGAEEWLNLICDVLSCALDAAGVTGLLLAKDTILVTSQGNNTSKDLVLTQTSQLSMPEEPTIVEEMLLTSLSFEIQSACTALQNASTMSTILSDLLNRAAALKAAGRKQPKPSTQSRSPMAPKSKVNEIEERKKAILPLGYPVNIKAKRKAEANLQKTTRRKEAGGRKDPVMGAVDFARRNRTEQYRKNTSYGPYTLERWDL